MKKKKKLAHSKVLTQYDISDESCYSYILIHQALVILFFFSFVPFCISTHYYNNDKEIKSFRNVTKVNESD